MAKKASLSLESTTPVTPERGIRLYRLVTLLGEHSQTRDFLTRRLDIGIRDFYRDLGILRKGGLEIKYEQGRYTLVTELATAQSLIPFPNPCLTLGQAEQLAKGRFAAHRKLKEKVQTVKEAKKPRRKNKPCLE